ncbi:MAG: pilus assembly protein TadG-related protein [Nocardioides sp.]
MTIMIVGFAVVLAMAVAVVTDASAAYLRRQGLDTLADGAALSAADAAASGDEAYHGGVGAELVLTEPEAQRAVVDYLVRVGAYGTYPGLAPHVSVDRADHRVTVSLSAPLHLPLTVPGSPDRASVGATSSAEVTIDP